MDTKQVELAELSTWKRFRLNDLYGVVVCQVTNETDVIMSPNKVQLEKELLEYLDADDIENLDMVETIPCDTIVTTTIHNPFQMALL